MNPIIFLSLGPGDPDLLTVKAVKTLKAADVIMVPATGSRSRAADIIREWCDKSRLTVYELPMLKDRQAVSAVYDRIYADCVSLYHKGRRVVVAVEGDVSSLLSHGGSQFHLKQKKAAAEKAAENISCSLPPDSTPPLYFLLHSAHSSGSFLNIFVVINRLFTRKITVLAGVHGNDDLENKRSSAFLIWHLPLPSQRELRNLLRH